MKRLFLLTALVAAGLAMPTAAHATDHFIVQCDYSHSLKDDPIVYPNQPGASHMHDFMGNRTTDAFSTWESLLAVPKSNTGTSCGATSDTLVTRLGLSTKFADTAAYWMPAAWYKGQRYLPDYTRIYYHHGAAPIGKVTPIPAGAKLLGGSVNATGPSPGIVSFSCGANTPGDTPASGQPGYNCNTNKYLGGDDSKDGLIGRIIFPQCWDGAGLNPSDFHYGGCNLAAGEKWIPRIRMSYHYRILGPRRATCVLPSPDNCGLMPSEISFGDAPNDLAWYQLHGDFFNAWVQSDLVKATNAWMNQPNSLPSFYTAKAGDQGTPSAP